jgi:LmbE family N-acetylglucosaminyl deacetylase
MAFRDLFREFEGVGPFSSPQTKEEKLPMEITPLPRAELLVNNSLENLRSLSLETRKQIRVLFILAHPDDEATHLVSLKVLTELGFQVQISWLTYGDASTKAETKMKESTEVLSSIGNVERKFIPNKVHDVVNSVFRPESPEAQREAISRTVDQIRDDVRKASFVITNAFEGGHLLHDFTRIIAGEVAQAEGKEVLEIPQYSIKTWRDMLSSAVRALFHLEFGPHIFYNVGEFREGKPQEDQLHIQNGAQEIVLPSTMHLTNTAVTAKAGLLRLYDSQWKTVFSGLLEAVEFNGSEDREYVRKAQRIPRLYETLMHWKNIVLSRIRRLRIVHPRKLYEVQEVVKDIVEKSRAESAQQ